jgi:hypothetical protein
MTERGRAHRPVRRVFRGAAIAGAVAALALAASAAPAGAAYRLRVSGSFALRLVYDDNIIHYSDEDLLEFETDPAPGKYSIDTAGDWILRPRLTLEAANSTLTGKKLEARLILSTWRYVENGVKDNDSMSLRLKHPGPLGRDNLQLTLYYSPESYLRNFRDRPPFESQAHPFEYTDFSYTSTSLTLGHWKRYTKKLEGKLELKRSWRYYNRPFMENDNWEWRFGGYVAYRVAKPLKIRAEYSYSNSEARAIDAVGETRENTNDGDASYERDAYEVTLDFYVPKNPLAIDRVAISGGYQAYFFTSALPPEVDRYHVGRKDEMFRTEVRWSTDEIWRTMSLEGGYRFTERDSSAPWETGEGESIDEDKDYTDNRFWFGVEYGF